MLRVEGLRRRVDGFELAIDEWSIDTGQYLVLVGRSGAGKTMFLETVAGLHRCDAGRIWIDGREVTHIPPEQRGIGFVYQDCWLFPHLTVRANIDFGRRYQRDHGSTASTDALAEMLHITPLLGRKPDTLSGGERQRVALARALAVRPRLLFLDEPLGTLDPTTREHVAAELTTCHRSFGTTTIHVTHDHAEARMMGDSVGVIIEGRLAQAGPTEEVFRRPATRALAQFLGCENLFEVNAAQGSRPGHISIGLDESVMEVPSPLSGIALMCVRPEDISVRRAGHQRGDDSAEASLDGTLIEIGTRGVTIRYVIESGDRRWVALVGRAEHRSSGLAVGERVRMSMPVDTIHLIPPG